MFELIANIFILCFCVVFMLGHVVRQSQQEDAEDVRQTAARSLTTALDDVLCATEHKAPKRKRECELPKEAVIWAASLHQSCRGPRACMRRRGRPGRYGLQLRCDAMRF